MATEEILVVVFLRGGCDGLNLVGPAGDKHYTSERFPDVRVQRKGDNAGLPLPNPISDGDFRLHPNAAELKTLYDRGHLAIVHACGLTNGTRSHFEAMDYMERGTPENKLLSTGWLARHLQLMPPSGLIPIVSTGFDIPASLLGNTQAVSIPDPAALAFGSPSAQGEMQKTLLRRLYSGSGDRHATGTRMLDVIDQVSNAITRDESGNAKPYQPEHGTAYPESHELAGGLKSVARLVKMDVGLRYATADYSGWDTHVQQAGYFPTLADGLSKSLKAFWDDMTAYQERLTVVVMSEFGRRLKSNESYGTDHGYGNMMLVLGGSVNGGRMFGRWPGLSTEQLDDGADLAVTTDYRTVLAEIMLRRLRNPHLGKLFPNFSGYAPLGLVRGEEMTPEYAA